MKTNVIIGVIAFGLGYAVHFWFGTQPKNLDAGNTRQHWEVWERYKSEFSDPKNAEVIDGMLAVKQITDPLPALAALVAAGEIEHVDLVLPNVPSNRKANLYWMRYVNENDDLLYVTGNPSYVDFEPSGIQPLHLNLWFRDSAKSEVQQLIQNLESTADFLVPNASETESDSTGTAPPPL